MSVWTAPSTSSLMVNCGQRSVGLLLLPESTTPIPDNSVPCKDMCLQIVIHRAPSPCLLFVFSKFDGNLPAPSLSLAVFVYHVSSSSAETDVIPLVSHSDLRQPHLSTKAPLLCILALEQGRSSVFRGTFLFK